MTACRQRYMYSTAFYIYARASFDLCFYFPPRMPVWFLLSEFCRRLCRELRYHISPFVKLYVQRPLLNLHRYTMVV
jgi:hypothetical protein